MSLRYDSAARDWKVITELLDLVRYRDLLRLLIANSIKTRYKRSVLGVLWTLLNPLLTTVVLTIAFSTLFRFTVKNYPVHLLSGIILWNFFAQTTTVAIGALVWGGSLLKRIYVPRTIFSVAAIGNGLVNLTLALVPLALLMVLYRLPFRPALLFVPVAILITAVFALGVALLVSTLAVFFVDVVDIYGVLLSAWFYLTPIIYPKEMFPPQYAWLLHFNPLYNFIDLFRLPIYEGVLPGPGSLLAGTVWAVSALLVGWWLFTRKSDEFAYRI